MERVRRLVAALWFGSAIFLMLTSSAAFDAAGNTTIAADVVGSIGLVLVLTLAGVAGAYFGGVITR